MINDDPELLRQSQYMDVDYYLERNPDVRLAGSDPIEHFLHHGWKEERSPSETFSIPRYFAANPDVAAAGVNPLVHYLRHGKRENRRLGIRPYPEYLRESITSYLGDPREFSSRSSAVTQHRCRVAVVIHIHFEDLAGEARRYVENVPGACDVFITTSDVEGQQRIEAIFDGYESGSVGVTVVPNRGRDIAPFLLEFSESFDEYDYVCKIHTKKSLHASEDYADEWRRHLLQNLLGSPHVVDDILALFESDAEIGLIYPPASRDVYPYANWSGYEEDAAELLSEMGIGKHDEALEGTDFPAGTMFWVRPQAMLAMAEHFLPKGYEGFPAEPVAKDFTLLHVLERIIPVVCERAGYRVVCAGVRSGVDGVAETH